MKRITFAMVTLTFGLSASVGAQEKKATVNQVSAVSTDNMPHMTIAGKDSENLAQAVSATGDYRAINTDLKAASDRSYEKYKVNQPQRAKLNEAEMREKQAGANPVK